MSLHLLVETAIYDSSSFDILEYEQLELMKKEYSSLAAKVEGAKRRLQMETKVRDAAMSLARLYGGSKKGPPPEQEEELKSAQRKCEEISRELWNLNTRLVEVQRVLLMHNAAVLGLGMSKKEEDEKEGGDEGWGEDGGSLYRSPDGYVDPEVVSRVKEVSEVIAGVTGKMRSRPQTAVRRPGGGELEAVIEELEQSAEFLRLNPPGKTDPNVEAEMKSVKLELGQHQQTIAELWDLLILEQEADHFSTSFSLSTFSSKIRQLLDSHRSATVELEQKTEELQGLLKQSESQRNKDHRKTLDLTTALTKSTADMEALRAAKLAVDQELLDLTAARDELRRQLADETRAREIVERQADVLLEEKAEHMSAADTARDERDQVQAELNLVIAETETRLGQLEAELKHLRQAKGMAEGSSTEMAEQVAQLTADLNAARGEIARLNTELTAAKQAADKSTAELTSANMEISHLSSKIAELSTVAAIAQAELDAVHGSKQQRAAETAQARAAAEALAKAANQPQQIDLGMLEEIEQLAGRNKKLESELQGCVEELRVVTGLGVEWERERERLEGHLERSKERADALETKLREAEVSQFGGRLSVSAISDAGRSTPGMMARLDPTSMQTMRSEFRKMVREMREEQRKALKVSHNTQHCFVKGCD